MKNLFIPAFVLSFLSFKTSVAQQASTDKAVEFVSPQKQAPPAGFEVKQTTYQVQDAEVLATLKNNENKSYISVGKTVNLNTFTKEQERIYLLLYAFQPKIQRKDIKFNVDTTQQRHTCSVVTVVKTAQE